MFYIFSYTPGVNDLVTAKHIIPMHLTIGVIHQVDVLFQSGCAHQEFVQIRKGNTQLWPSNRDEALRGDATVISFRDFEEIKQGGDELQALVWSTKNTPWYEIIIQIGLLPKKVLQPLSFDELLKAATGA
jgi:hypothetical protein